MDADRNLAAERWLAVGQSNDADARTAGHAAATQALAGPISGFHNQTLVVLAVA